MVKKIISFSLILLILTSVFSLCGCNTMTQINASQNESKAKSILKNTVKDDFESFTINSAECDIYTEIIGLKVATEWVTVKAIADGEEITFYINVNTQLVLSSQYWDRVQQEYEQCLLDAIQIPCNHSTVSLNAMYENNTFMNHSYDALVYEDRSFNDVVAREKQEKKYSFDAIITIDDENIDCKKLPLESFLNEFNENSDVNIIVYQYDDVNRPIGTYEYCIQSDGSLLVKAKEFQYFLFGDVECAFDPAYIKVNVESLNELPESFKEKTNWGLNSDNYVYLYTPIKKYKITAQRLDSNLSYDFQNSSGKKTTISHIGTDVFYIHWPDIEDEKLWYILDDKVDSSEDINKVKKIKYLSTNSLVGYDIMSFLEMNPKVPSYEGQKIEMLKDKNLDVIITFYTKETVETIKRLGN